MAIFKYKAFISYSHEDKGWAYWLHRRLESYVFPKNLIGSQTSVGEVPRHLRPIFRDREELAAGHNLGEKIESALKSSENLIVLCSPNSAHSHWVNEEILFFKRHNCGAKIFSVIVKGEPFSEDLNLECFPESLRFELSEAGDLTTIQAEPLAADLRDSADGKRLGILKLISGMVGLGVNDLVQRDLQRARKRVTSITTSAAAIVLAMGVLTWAAIDARQEAELRRNDAEGQIEFMLTDLKDKLEGVGRLDALEVVGDKAALYYDQYSISDHDDDALGRRARVYHYLGEIQEKLGNLDEAELHFQNAYAATGGLLGRNQNNPDRIFDHSQSAFWAGYVPFKEGAYEEALPYYEDYLQLAIRLKDQEPNNIRGMQEEIFAWTNIATLKVHMNEKVKAAEIYELLIPEYKEIIEAYPDNLNYGLDLADAYAWLSDVYAETDLTKSLEYRTLQNSVYSDFETQFPDNAKLLHRSLTGQAGIARTEYKLGDFETTREILLESIPNAVGLVMRNPENVEWLSTLTILQLILAETSLAQELYLNAKVDFSKLAEYENRLDVLSGGKSKYFISYSSRAREGRTTLKNKLN